MLPEVLHYASPPCNFPHITLGFAGLDRGEESAVLPFHHQLMCHYRRSFYGEIQRQYVIFIIREAASLVSCYYPDPEAAVIVALKGLSVANHDTVTHCMTHTMSCSNMIRGKHRLLAVR